jgi:hypothetical protein
LATTLPSPDSPALLELTSAQRLALEGLVARGFTLVAFPLYATAVGVRRDQFAALLTPIDKGGWRLLGDACYLIEGNLGVRVQRDGRQWFVWKSKRVEATQELLSQVKRFSDELSEFLTSEA